MMARGRRSEALLLLHVGDMDAELREALVRKLDDPLSPLPDAHALVERHLGDAVVQENGTSIGATHLYIWLGDFDGAGRSDDHVTTTISAWDRYPPAWRNSP